MSSKAPEGAGGAGGREGQGGGGAAGAGAGEPGGGGGRKGGGIGGAAPEKRSADARRNIGVFFRALTALWNPKLAENDITIELEGTPVVVRQITEAGMLKVRRPGPGDPVEVEPQPEHITAIHTKLLRIFSI